MLFDSARRFISRYKKVFLLPLIAIVIAIASITYFSYHKVKNKHTQILLTSVENINKQISFYMSANIIQSYTIADYFNHLSSTNMQGLYKPTEHALSLFSNLSNNTKEDTNVSTSNILFVSIPRGIGEPSLEPMLENNVATSTFIKNAIKIGHTKSVSYTKKFYDTTDFFILDPFNTEKTNEYFIPIAIKNVQFRTKAGIIDTGIMCTLYSWDNVRTFIDSVCNVRKLDLAIMGYDRELIYGTMRKLFFDPESLQSQIRLPYKAWNMAAAYNNITITSIISEILRESWFMYLIVILGVVGACIVILTQYKQNSDLNIKCDMILNNVHDTAWVIKVEDFRFVWVSDSVKHIVGKKPKDVIRSTISDVVDTETSYLFRETVNEHIATAVLNKDYSSFNFTLEGLAKHVHGYDVWVEISSILISNNGKFDEIHGVTRRIDDRKEAQTLLMRQHEELLESNKTKNMLFSIIAHDLRNPFSALLNIAEVLAGHFERMDKQTLTKSIGIILSSANHIYKLLENLLMWSRTQTGSLAYNPQKINLQSLVHSTIELLEPQALNKDIKLKLVQLANVPAETTVLQDEQVYNPDVFVDEDMISTVLRNIITNAIKFSFEHSEVTIDFKKFEKDTKYVLISVKDSGVGMPQCTVDNLFQIKSVKSTQGTKKEPGTGLGLIVVKDFIDKHSGKIWAESTEGQGTTFYFTLLCWSEHNKNNELPIDQLVSQ